MTEWTDRDGMTRPLVLGDVRIVAPYNAQVSLLAKALPAGTSVGTSRARGLVVVVGSPEILNPACRTPNQMKLAKRLLPLRGAGRVAGDDEVLAPCWDCLGRPASSGLRLDEVEVAEVGAIEASVAGEKTIRVL